MSDLIDGNCGCDHGNGCEPGHFECRPTRAGYRNIGRQEETSGWAQEPIPVSDVAEMVVRPVARAGDPRVEVTQARRVFDPIDDRVELVVIWESDEVWRLVVDGDKWRSALAVALAG